MKQMPDGLEDDLRAITHLCANYIINWAEKEDLCDRALAICGWTREDLRKYNKERENAANQQTN